jgi:hypothetical protein
MAARAARGGRRHGLRRLDVKEYVLDAAALDRNKGCVILRRAISEEPGVEDCANWLHTFIGEVRPPKAG